MSKPDIREVFADLEQETATEGKLRVSGTGVTVAEGELLCAVDSRGRRRLLVPTPKDKGATDSASLGISVLWSPVDDEKVQASNHLVVTCEVFALGDLFASVVTDILRAVSLDTANPESATFQVIERYRELFGPRPSKLLGPRQLAALFAELVVLEQLVAKDGPVAAWTGPDNDRHDFRGPAGAIEVKSTLSTEHRRFITHGVKQLEAPEVGPLYLHLVRVEPQLGGTSVPQIVERIRDNGAGEDMALFGQLAKVGYRHEDGDAYREVAFSVLDQETHLVDDSFPRIKPEDAAVMPPAISGLQYTIDLAAHPHTPFEGGLDAAVAVLLGS